MRLLPGHLDMNASQAQGAEFECRTGLTRLIGDLFGQAKPSTWEASSLARCSSMVTAVGTVLPPCKTESLQTG